MYPDSASKYGLWDVPKAYYHLYGDNTITLDVDTPLDKLGSRTSVQVLQDAFKNMYHRYLIHLICLTAVMQ